jgi:hypothetical protein
MKVFLVISSWFLVCSQPRLLAKLRGLAISSFLVTIVCLAFVHPAAANEEPGTNNQEQKDEPFRPEPGKFPPLEKAHSFRGELVFVDHANRRGSIRVQGDGMYFRNPPQPFAMLPYGMVSYHGAPADLRDIPLGTVLHVRSFLPPDPKTSVVPVLPVNSKDETHGYSGKGIAPAENHVLLLEDEPSHCQREGKVWKLMEVELNNNAGPITARRESKAGGDGETEEKTMSFDAAIRIWRGRERLSVKDLINGGIWPKDGKQTLDGQAVQLGITWKPTYGNGFNHFHVSDIWLDDAAMHHATDLQSEMHKAFMRSRWLPARVDAVDYGEFGQAEVTATLFGGMDDSLYADFKKGGKAMMNGATTELKHVLGPNGPWHMAAEGPVLEVTKNEEKVPLGSSGIQIRMKVGLVQEGLRPGKTVRVRPMNWPKATLPREEWLPMSFNIEERFPTPAIFPKYGR